MQPSTRIELSQMPIRERNTRPGFQITFKGNSATLVGEFDHDIDRPRAMPRRVGAAACIVLGTSARHVCSEAGVVLRRTLIVREDVHETRPGPPSRRTLWTSCGFIPAIALDPSVVEKPAAGPLRNRHETTLDNNSIIG